MLRIVNNIPIGNASAVPCAPVSLFPRVPAHFLLLTIVRPLSNTGNRKYTPICVPHVSLQADSSAALNGAKTTKLLVPDSAFGGEGENTRIRHCEDQDGDEGRLETGEDGEDAACMGCSCGSDDGTDTQLNWDAASDTEVEVDKQSDDVEDGENGTGDERQEDRKSKRKRERVNRRSRHCVPGSDCECVAAHGRLDLNQHRWYVFCTLGAHRVVSACLHFCRVKVISTYGLPPTHPLHQLRTRRVPLYLLSLRPRPRFTNTNQRSSSTRSHRVTSFSSVRKRARVSYLELELERGVMCGYGRRRTMLRAGPKMTEVETSELSLSARIEWLDAG